MNFSKILIWKIFQQNLEVNVKDKLIIKTIKNILTLIFIILLILIIKKSNYKKNNKTKMIVKRKRKVIYYLANNIPDNLVEMIITLLRMIQIFLINLMKLNL